MQQFKPIDIADKATIEHYIHKSNCRSCSFSIANIFCWQKLQQTHWAVINDFLVLRIKSHDGKQPIYLEPMGEGDFSQILPTLAQDAQENFGAELHLYIYTEEAKTIIESKGDEYIFTEERAHAEYIYLADDLRTLAGKKLQPKRNHNNYFTTNYNYRYEELAPHHFEECLSLDAKWRKERCTNEDRGLCRHERGAIEEAFRLWNELGLTGGVLFVDDEIVAFTYGVKINHDTFNILIEKGDTSYKGVFATINKLFVTQIPQEYIYINREEDLGLVGLRHAKMTYNPKSLLAERHIKTATPDDKACKALWKEAFGDDDAFIDNFIIRYSNNNTLLTIKEQEEIVSMLHIIPFEHEDKKIGYIYGVATALKERGKGHARKLMKIACERGKAQGCSALALIPQSDSLKKYYESMGYTGEYNVLFLECDDFDFGTGCMESDRLSLLPLEESFALPPTDATIALTAL